MRRFHLMLLLCCCSLVPVQTGPAWAAEASELAVRPQVLNIGTFFSGGQVIITGEVPQGQDVIVEITGPTANGQFDIKGRVGPFWMTRGKAELNGAPAMYVLLLPEDQRWRQEAASLGLGLANLRKRMSIHAGERSAEDLFNMFLELKKGEGLYVEAEGAVTYTPAENGLRRFTAVCHFPRSTAVGDYTIRATTVADGAKVAELSRGFLVNEVGFTRVVDDLATNRRLTYGILAVVIALFTGAVMGVLFKGGGGH
jgi:Putative transmembrane protein (Alph_Pro_TM)